MKRVSALRAAAFATALFSASVALSHVHPFGDPLLSVSADHRGGIDHLLASSDIPQQAKDILIAKCADCHSNSTRRPVYSHTAPVSWLVERDVIEGRKRMNLSSWNELSSDAHQLLLSKILRETRTQKMPPMQYRLLHWESRLSDADMQALAGLVGRAAAEDSEIGRVGDPSRGKEVFEKRCTGCHALDANREGPHLRGVYGRRAGSVTDFTYSKAIQQSTFRWTEESLERWLTDPDEMIPGNNMSFRVVKASDRSDVIAFLRQLNGSTNFEPASKVILPTPRFN